MSTVSLEQTSSALSRSDRIRLLASFLVFPLLWCSGLFMVAAVLLPQRLRDVMGADAATAAFGVINACTAFISLLSNLVVGNLSDHTRSRFGRRTPWVISGGIVGGVSLALVGFLDNVWLIGISYCARRCSSASMASTSATFASQARRRMGPPRVASNMCGRTCTTVHSDPTRTACAAKNQEIRYKRAKNTSPPMRVESLVV